MEKIISRVLIFIMSVLILPLGVYAKESEYLGETYNTLNLKEALKDEEIEETFKNYSENNDQVIVYLFRGKGCTFCRGFLTFLDNIVDEYGKYFKLVSFEVWNDSTNSSLMDKVADYTGKDAEGVPYIVIGDKVYAGFTEDMYGSEVKDAIKTLYDTPKNERYDVFEEMKNNPKNDQKNSNTSNSSLSDGKYAALIILPIICISISTICIIAYNNSKFNKLELELKKINKEPKKK